MSEESGNWVSLEAPVQLSDGEMFEATINNVEIAVYKVEGVLYATDNVCTHAYAMLTDGWLDDHTIECPLHGGQFDIRNGRAVKLPAECDLKTYKVRATDMGVEVFMPK